MTGNKGSGKTLTLALLANQVVKELDLPVVVVRTGYSGTEFDSFIQSLGEVCIIFDEVAKMYESYSETKGPNQSALLSLMDGTDKVKRMFILTENRETDINEFMFNRPGRIYYHFRFKKIDEDSITDYCTDCAVPKNVVDDILEVSRRTPVFNFDMLQTIIEEYNRYGNEQETSVSDIIEDLNVDIREVNTDRIQIDRIVKKGSGEEIKLATKQQSVILKPTNGDAARIVACRPNFKASINKPRLAVDSASDSVEHVGDEDIFTIYIEDNEIVYQSKDGILVYETPEHIVHTHVLETIPYHSISAYF
jgi:hypothetical protein